MKRFIAITFTIVFLFLITTAAKRAKERTTERTGGQPNSGYHHATQQHSQFWRH